MAKPYDPKDFYYRKAKKAGLRARSAFKIEEILRRHRLLGKGDAVLDLGAAPRSRTACPFPRRRWRRRISSILKADRARSPAFFAWR